MVLLSLVGSLGSGYQSQRRQQTGICKYSKGLTLLVNHAITGRPRHRTQDVGDYAVTTCGWADLA